MLLFNSVLSSSLAYGFMGGTEVSITIKILCGFIFSLTPLLAIRLIIVDYGSSPLNKNQQEGN